MENRLVRSDRDKVIAGVCGGLGKYFNIDPVLVRIIMVALLMAGSAGFWIYILAWIFIPLESDLRKKNNLSEEEFEEMDEETRLRRQKMGKNTTVAIAGILILSGFFLILNTLNIFNIFDILSGKMFFGILLLLIGGGMIYSFIKGERK